jgi:hypothetical protein
VLRAAKQRGAFGAMGPSAPLAPTTTFGGLNQAGLAATDNTPTNQGTPPDTTGAIGLNHYVEFVNSKVRVFNSVSLSAVSSANLDTFVGKSGDSVFDPQIQWDAQAGRWLYVADDQPSSGNFLVFGFSKTSDPSDLVNGWCRYSVSTGTNFNDYPKLGHNDNNMIFGANVFVGSAFTNAALWTAPKPAVGSTTCPASVAATSFNLGSSVFTPVPANTSDSSANGYVVAANDPGSGSASHVGAWHVSGPAAAPTVTSDGSMTVSSYSVPANVPQPGSTDTIDSSDARLTQAVARADPGAGGAEAVWTQHTVAGAGGRSVVRWYELLPASLTVRQQGTIQDASNFDFNGAISPSGSGNEAVINYNVGSAAQLVQIRAQSRTGSAALGTMSSETTLGTSAAIDQDFSCPSVDPSQPSCRWGDYAGASPDPSNNNVVWGSSQLNGPISGTSATWTTRNFALDPGDPTVITGAASSVARNTGTIAGTVNPNGQATTYHFEYGTTPSYGSSAPSPDASAGSGTSATPVSTGLSGLAAGTTYHYRLVAANAAGTSYSADKTFTTASPPAVSLTDPANGSSVNTGAPTFAGSAGTAGGDLPMVTVNVYSGSAAAGSPVETLTTTASGGAWSAPASPALSDGTYTAQAQQSDSDGNVGLSLATTFMVDTTTVPPTSSVSTPPASPSGGSPSTPGSQPPRVSVTAPALSAGLFRQNLRGLLARGYVIYVRSDRVVNADVALVMGRTAARRIGISSASREVVLGRVVKRVTSRQTRILVTLTRKAKAALKRLSKVTVILTIKVTDAAGKSTTARRTLTLKR